MATVVPCAREGRAEGATVVFWGDLYNGFTRTSDQMTKSLYYNKI